MYTHLIEPPPHVGFACDSQQASTIALSLSLSFSISLLLLSHPPTLYFYWCSELTFCRYVKALKYKVISVWLWCSTARGLQQKYALSWWLSVTERHKNKAGKEAGYHSLYLSIYLYMCVCMYIYIKSHRCVHSLPLKSLPSIPLTACPAVIDTHSAGWAVLISTGIRDGEDPLMPT